MAETKKKTILLVDDDPTIRKILKGFLNTNFDLIEAGDPKKCLENLATTTPRIDLGLIDVEMPHMDGFKLVKMIRKHPAYVDVPFVMVTIRDKKESVNQAVIAGACDYIVKPFDKETLLLKINKHLNSAQSS